MLEELQKIALEYLDEFTPSDSERKALELLAGGVLPSWSHDYAECLIAGYGGLTFEFEFNLPIWIIDRYDDLHNQANILNQPKE